MSTTRGPVIDPLKCLIVQLNETILLIHLRVICIWSKMHSVQNAFGLEEKMISFGPVAEFS